MSSRDFVYWLMGYFELSTPGTALSPAQVDCIQRHLSLVFLHEIDPSEPGDPAVLQAVHDGSQIISGGSGGLCPHTGQVVPTKPYRPPGSMEVRC